MTASAGRRSYDDMVDAAIELFVEEKLQDTRHMLRGEFAETLLKIQAQSSKEHGEVRQSISDLTKAVNALELHDAKSEGASELRKSIWLATGVIVGAFGALAAYLSIALH